ncbi:MAG: translation initiation factor [Bacteroidota bacterium]|nr:translation initiation factor [Bacteroidota bacterium]MEC9231847.1 translation initiation factor [Bacteroidota bacterium]
MSKKSKKNRINVVYSTNPNFEYEEEFDEVSSIPFSEQNLYVLVDRKNRGGKTVTLIEGFTGSDEDANDLAKKLKQKCGVGGGFKQGEIYVQGDHRNKVQQFLKDLGANVKFKGG